MKIYAVGGAIRDTLMGLPVHDIDYVVVGSSVEEMIAQGYRPVGKDFPVFLHPDTQAEYALARTERKTGKGYKGFMFYADPTVTLEQDLERRDLTINAMAQEVGGRCAQQALVTGDLAGDDPRIGWRAKADAHIKGIVTQRGRVDRQLQLHIDLRVLLHKAADQRPHVAAAKAQGGIDPQQAAGRGAAGTELLLQVGHFGQDAAGVAQHGFAFHRQAHAPRGAVDQGYAQAGFHLRQAFAHCSGGDAHLAGGGAQAAGHGQCRKKAQISGLQAWFHC